MTRLPAIRRWANDLRNTKSGAQKVAVSADYLTGHREELASFEDVEHLGLSADSDLAPTGATEDTIKTAKALVHHVVAIRSVLARELWSRQLFIDTEIIDDLIFYAVRDGDDPDPIHAVLARIRDARINRPGFLIFPVHSLGVMAGGLLLPFRRQSISFINADHGYALSPQTNSLTRSLEFLDGVRESFGIKKRIPVNLIRHWHRSRDTTWLERNPLLIVRTIQWPGSYYGNEWLLLSRLRASAGVLSMLSALQPHREEITARQFSSAMVNNWQTLDIHHYFALYDWPNRKKDLDGQCVPIHTSRIAVTELSNLPIEVDPRYWNRNTDTGERVHAAMDKLYEAYLRQRFTRRRNDAVTRTVRRFFESVDYFRRSFHRSEDDFVGLVSLSTAFEMLLTDNYGAVQQTLVKRTGLLLKGAPGTRTMQKAVGDLYESRSEMVHGGIRNTSTDVVAARRAYTLCFVTLADRLPSLSPKSLSPVKDLCGDR